MDLRTFKQICWADMGMKKAIKKLISFIFGKQINDCINCIHSTSTGAEYPCCDCNNTKYYVDKRYI